MMQRVDNDNRRIFHKDHSREVFLKGHKAHLNAFFLRYVINSDRAKRDVQLCQKLACPYFGILARPSSGHRPLGYRAH